MSVCKDRQLTVELAKPRNKLFIKCQNDDGVQDKLKAKLQEWQVVEYGEPEFSEDKKCFFFSAKFKDEAQARSFLQAYQ